MTYNVRLEEAAAFVRERDDFLVVSHVQPDGDAISSTVAVAWLLGRLGKRYTLANEGRVPPRLAYLWNSDRIVSAAEGKPERTFRNVIAVDCADYGRIGSVREWFAADAELLNIDHHPTNDGFGLVNVVHSDAAATAEILYDWIRIFNLPFDADIATAVYTGLMTDTGGFRYSNTSPHVMNIASRMLEAGANGPELAERLLERMTMGQMEMLRRALARLTFSADQRIGWLWVTPEDLSDTGASNEDLEGLVNYPRNIEGVEVGLLFKQQGANAVKISLRSAGLVDVSAVAQRFGGGGHVRASGCRVEAGMDEAIAKVVAAVQEALEEAGHG